MTLSFYNTLSQTKESFKPKNPKHVSMYVCGPTVYDLCHIGHCRVFVSFDLVHRYLKFSGYEVTFVQNFTDVDDKIINRAKELNKEPLALSQYYIDQYYQDTEPFRLQRPNHSPKVSEHIDGIILHIQGLIDKHIAYISDQDVFFSVSSFSDYGQLSKRSLDELMAGARVEINEKKRDPLDFSLWKKAKPGELSWESPWGKGRPGWHIECSVMSECYLGNTFDIHGGGMDLIFPHHENEIAQSQALHGHNTFARYWMHNGFVNIDGEKMSKSLGNFFTIRDVLKKYHADVIRFYLLSTHYRSPLNFSDTALNEAEKRLWYFNETIDIIKNKFFEVSGKIYTSRNIEKETLSLSLKQHLENDPISEFISALDDDCNTPKAFGNLASFFKWGNQIVLEKPCSIEKLEIFLQTIDCFNFVLQIWPENTQLWFQQIKHKKAVTIGIEPSEIENLIQQRLSARKNRDFALADSIRDSLKQKGIELKDHAKGTDWIII